MKRWYGFAVLMLFLVFYNIVGTMEVKLEMDKQRMSIEAAQAQAQYSQAQIDRIRNQLSKADEQLHSFNLLVWEMRERLHLDLELDLKEEGN